ncbi:hypothetical protein [Rhizobacter fulvus]
MAARGWVAALLAVSAAPGVAAEAACDGLAEVPLVPVAAQVWRVPAARGESDAANGGVVAQLVVVQDGARVWLVGSGPTPAFGAALGCAIQRRVGRPVSDLVNTRAAPELALGNAAFPAARAWALPDVIATMRARCGTCLDRLKARIGAAGESLRHDRIRVPTQPVGGAGASRGALGPFAWRALPRARGERTLVLRHRATSIVVAQGLLWTDDVPDLRETDSALLLASLRALQRFAVGARLLGEQGDVADAHAVARQVAYVDALRGAVRSHLERGDVDGAAGIGVDLPGFAALPGYARRHPLNLQRVWREREAELMR